MKLFKKYFYLSIYISLVSIPFFAYFFELEKSYKELIPVWFLLLFGLQVLLLKNRDEEKINVFTLTLSKKNFNHLVLALNPILLFVNYTSQFRDAWQIYTIAALILYGLGAYFFLASESKYLIDEAGIKDSSARFLFKIEILTRIEMSSEKIAFHTTKYTNHLIISKKELFSPKWEEVLKEINEIYPDYIKNEISNNL